MKKIILLISLILATSLSINAQGGRSVYFENLSENLAIGLGSLQRTGKAIIATVQAGKTKECSISFRDSSGEPILTDVSLELDTVFVFKDPKAIEADYILSYPDLGKIMRGIRLTDEVVINGKAYSGKAFVSLLEALQEFRGGVRVPFFTPWGKPFFPNVRKLD